MVAALWAVFKFHQVKHFPDLYSVHSWFGIVTVSLVLLQVLFEFKNLST